MSVDLTGIVNQNEFYSNYYLSDIFEKDLAKHLEQWGDSSEKQEIPPCEKLRGLRRDFVLLHESLQKEQDAARALSRAEPFETRILNLLGFDYAPCLKSTERGMIPVCAETVHPNGSPHLWAIRLPAGETDPLHSHFLPEQYSGEPDPKKRFLNEKDDDLETLITREIFTRPEPPRWIIALQYDQIMLIDRSKWNDKRLLRFDLAEILNRCETSTLKAMTMLLHRVSLCPEAGKSLLDELDENSHRNAFAVSADLKYSAREAVELIGNEAIRHICEVQKKPLAPGAELASQLSAEALRYLYRLLFLFYLEARTEKLGLLPMQSEAYKTTYSLESLRELELTPLRTPDEQNGYFFDHSIKKLFQMISHGVFPSAQGEFNYEATKPLFNEFSIPKMESHLFDAEKTPLLNSVKLRNRVWQKIIQLLSLSREQAGRRRGRISYARLGIMQLGSVYEGLLSYRGFFARSDLYEVHKKGEKYDPLQQAFFVNAEQLRDYSQDERVFDKEGNLLKHPKGTFLYRMAGRDREKSASYYTPNSLTKCLVQYALRELIGEKPGDASFRSADEILKLTVCEPAMGSAAFLNEAVNQLADAYLRRKQQETGQWLSHDQIEEETRKVRLFLADRNIFGVDLNPVAGELGEISLWLNSMSKADFVPYFGGQLFCGNSLIGARRAVFHRKQAASPKRSWLDAPPDRVRPGRTREPGTIYHFLLPASGMANYTDKVIGDLVPEKIGQIKRWKKSFFAPFTDDEAALLEQISDGIDRLWEAHTRDLRDLRQETTDPLDIFGRKDDGRRKRHSLAEKDRSFRALYQTRIAQSPPYRRLKMIMDYWCALWFWPIEKADELPDRDTFLMDLQYILQGCVALPAARADQRGQMSLPGLDEILLRQQDRAQELGHVDIDELADKIPHLAIVQSVADRQHFHHWELECADLFADHGGFDLVLGNPPWVKMQWNEADFLSDYQPAFAVRKLSATQVAEIRESTLSQFHLLSAYLNEYESIAGTQNFLSAPGNYPDLRGIQPNLYKCFLPLAWSLNTPNGVSAFLHPEGVYDSSEGGALRRALYPRLRCHFQFINELRLFAEVAHQAKFSINISGAPLPQVRFRSIANLFTASAVAECFQRPAAPVGGIKDEQGQWNRNGHPDRIVEVTERELELFARLYDPPGTPGREARLPALHAVQMLQTLQKVAAFPHHLNDSPGDYFFTPFWDETNDQKKTRTIRRETRFPETPERVILSGPHFYVANPFYKTPRAVCRLSSDYDALDLTVLPADYLPRTNYAPDCGLAEYVRRAPYCPWDARREPETHELVVLRRVTDYFRLAFRNMIGSGQERTLISAIVPPGYAHIHVVNSICPRGCVLHTSTRAKIDHVDVLPTSTLNEEESGPRYAKLLDLAAICFSLIGDFYIKTMGRTHLFGSDLINLPRVSDKRLRLRVLLLSCLTGAYADLWRGAREEEDFSGDSWAKDDPRLPREAFAALPPEWNWALPLRTDYARRQALIEIDVLTARALGLSLDELCAIYRMQFHVLKKNESDTWYDREGRIVFTCSGGLPGVGLDRAAWEAVKLRKEGDPAPTRERNPDFLPEGQRAQVDRTIRYRPPFERADREADYRTAWEFFDRRKKSGSADREQRGNPE